MKFKIIKKNGYIRAINYGNQRVLSLIEGSVINEKYASIIVNLLNTGLMNDIMDLTNGLTSYPRDNNIGNT